MFKRERNKTEKNQNLIFELKVIIISKQPKNKKLKWDMNMGFFTKANMRNGVTQRKYCGLKYDKAKKNKSITRITSEKTFVFPDK